MTPLALMEASPATATLQVGAHGPAFEGLLGTDGKRYGFSTFANSDVLVLIFSSNRCPTAKAYADRMNALQRDFGARGMHVLAINSNSPQLYPDESYLRMGERATEDRYAFPYVVDEGQRVARTYGPTCTFHVFVLDRDRRLRYQGRFDDARLPERVTSHDLRNAVEDVLEDRDVRLTTTRPFGCALDFV